MVKSEGSDTSAKNTEKSPEKQNWSGNMPERTENIPIYEIVSRLSKAQREQLISGYDLKNFARIFEDDDIMTTADSFLRYGMNVSEASRRLYMHRNTLIYRLNKIQTLTGLDIRVFDSAVTFVILRILYELK